MKFGPICPMPHLEQFATGDYHLILAHLLKHTYYAAHYYQQAKNGAFITLDNSAYEFSESAVTHEELLQVAMSYNFREIVVPDAIGNRIRTHQLAEQALAYYSAHLAELEQYNVQLMLVPQATTIYDWGASACDLAALHMKYLPTRKFTIGIPKHTTSWPGGRANLLRRFIDNLVQQGGVNSAGIDVHLLGMGDDVVEIDYVAMHHKHVRSFDSVKPFTYARAGLKFPYGYGPTPANPGRPDDYFTQALDAQAVMLANYNVTNMNQRGQRQ